MDLTKEAAKLLLRHFPNVEWTEARLEAEMIYLHPDYLLSGWGIKTIPARDHMAVLDALSRALCDVQSLYRLLPPHIKSSAFHALPKGEMFGPTCDKMMVAVAAMRDAASASFALHHHQRANDFQAKAHLVRYARGMWRLHHCQEPPLHASPGTRFYEFVGDLVDFCGQEWGVDRALDAFAKYHAAGGEEWSGGP
jgi:hypothetical protein